MIVVIVIIIITVIIIVNVTKMYTTFYVFYIGNTAVFSTLVLLSLSFSFRLCAYLSTLCYFHSCLFYSPRVTVDIANCISF